MKKNKFLLILIFLFSCYFSKAQNDITEQSQNQKAYLAVLLQKAKTGKRSIIIQEEYVKLADKILKLSPNAANVDVIQNKSFQNIWLSLKKGKSLENLKKDAGFLKLVEKYKFTILRLEHGRICLKSSLVLDTELLYSDFSNLNTVAQVSLNNMGGIYINNVNGFAVTYKKENYILTYSTGWGDCPAGCIYRSYDEYVYTVKTNTIKLLRTYGDERGEPKAPDKD